MGTLAPFSLLLMRLEQDFLRDDAQAFRQTMRELANALATAPATAPTALHDAYNAPERVGPLP
jgi:hypothetical protein